MWGVGDRGLPDGAWQSALLVPISLHPARTFSTCTLREAPPCDDAPRCNKSPSAHPPTLQNGSQFAFGGMPISAAAMRRKLYGPLLSKLRALMIARMAKPEEVIVVEDENGNIVRETMKDTDVLARYKTMHETLVYLSHLDHEDTERQMLENLRLQVGWWGEGVGGHGCLLLPHRLAHISSWAARCGASCHTPQGNACSRSPCFAPPLNPTPHLSKSTAPTGAGLPSTGCAGPLAASPAAWWRTRRTGARVGGRAAPRLGCQGWEGGRREGARA